MEFRAVQLLLILCLYFATSAEGKSLHNDFKRQLTEPSAPTNLVLLERTNVSLYIMWDTPDSDGGSPITAYRVQTQNLRSFIIINREIGVVNTYNITDLTPFTIYSIRVAAFNDIGRGEQAIIENETLSERLEVIFNQIIGRTATTVHFRWREPRRDPDTTAPPLRYEINFREDGGPVTIINLLPEDYNANNGFDVDYTLRGLMCNTEYNITIVAFNIRGAGAAFPVPVFTTPLTKPSLPRNFVANPRDPNSVQLTWDEPSDTGCGPIVTYTLTFAQPSHLDVVLDGDVRSYLLLGLAPNTQYEVSLHAENAELSSDSVTQSGSTPGVLPPNTPAQPTVSDISDTSAVITWTLPGGFPQQFDLNYRKSSEDVSSEKVCKIDNINTLSKTLDDLDPLTSYTVRIRAGNSQGDSEFSGDLIFSTFGAIMIQATPPGAVMIGVVDSVVLQCTLEGAEQEDDINYQWSREGGSVPEDAIISGASLTFNNLRLDITGRYMCTAQQISGSYQLSVVAGPPGEVTSIQAAVAGETVLLSWTAAPNNGATVTYTVRVFRNGGLVHTDTTQSTSLSLTRNDFQTPEETRQDTTYDVVVQAINEEGAGEEVRVTKFVGKALPGGVSNIEVSYSDGRLTLEWDAPTINGVTVTEYRITISNDGEDVHTVTSMTTSVSVTRDNIQELGDVIRTENTNYEVTIVAMNNRGQGNPVSETFLIPSETAPAPELACTTTEESLVTLRVECQVVSVFDTTTTCSYDGLPSETCSVPFTIRYLDFEPGDHTLFLAVTALDGQMDNVTITFTTPLRLSVTCSVVNRVLTCESTTEIASQRCRFNNIAQIDCPSPFNLRALNLEQSEHTVTVSATDIFGQSQEFSLDFTTIPSQTITLFTTSTLTLEEGADTTIPFLFTIIGQAIEDIPFSLHSMSFQQYVDMTGQPLQTLFPSVPPAASSSDFDENFVAAYVFSASQDTETTNYDLSISLPDDDAFEGDEGFILYFEFDESDINDDDFSRLNTGTKTILVTISDNDGLTVECEREGDERSLTVSAECTASREVVSMTCSIDDLQPQPCNFPFTLALFQPGEHNLSITVTSTDGQMATDTITLTRPPFLTANCSVTRTILSCDTNNVPDSHFCLFDASVGTICSAMYDLQNINIQVGRHTALIFIRDEFSQQVQVDLVFTVISDLQIRCQELDSSLTVGGVDCQAEGGIGAIAFTCSVDDGPSNECGGFPVELDLFGFTEDQHILAVTATDAAGQPSIYNYTFSGIPDLSVTCSYADNILSCDANNQLTSQFCSFDQEQASECSFPLDIRVTGLRLGNHNVLVSVMDIFNQTDSESLAFEFALGPINVSIPATASVIEGKASSPVLFSISGQALSDFPFTVSPLTYAQFESQTGLMVDDLYDEVHLPANQREFDASTIDFNFKATDVTRAYTYNAVLEDDEEVENLEGFILYFEFPEDQFNSDDYNRLSQTTGMTLVTIIDDDGLMLTCKLIPITTVRMTVSCNASEEVTATCMYDGGPEEPCTNSPSQSVQLFDFRIDILDYRAGNHSVQVTVTDATGRLAADSISFTTPELPSATCGVTNNVLICVSNNLIDTQTCEVNGGPPVSCTSPFNVVDFGLSLGTHTLTVTITDAFGRVVQSPVRFMVVSDLVLVCSAVDETVFLRRVECSTTGGVRDVTYECTFNGNPIQNCAFPITYNIYEFSTTEHTFSVVVTDSLGKVKDYTFTFTGEVPPEYTISANTSSLTVNEDGSFRRGSGLSISVSGYSYGNIEVTLTPLTYSQFDAMDINAVVLQRSSEEASEGDFNTDIIRRTFRADLQDTPEVIPAGSSLPVDDTRIESNEGFLLYVEISEENLDSRDRGRTSFNGLVIPVSIIDDEDDSAEEGDELGLSDDELAGVIAGSIVFVLILATLALLICVCLALWKRRKQGGQSGIFRSRSRQSKSSSSSERRIFHAAR